MLNGSNNGAHSRNANAMKWFMLVTFVLMIATASSLAFWRPNSLPELGACTISIQQDLAPAVRQPLLLRPNVGLARSSNDAYYLPYNKYGDIAFNENDVLHLTCPNATVFLNGKNTYQAVIPVKCFSGKNFQVISTKESVKLTQFRCSQPGWTARYTGKSCLTGFKEIEIGFQVTASKFLRDITLCFDPVQQNAVYSSYNLTRAINGSQYSIPRPHFIQGGFYDTGNRNPVDKLYSRYDQRVNVNRQLGLSKNSKQYIGDGDFFLSRGHLTANADFVYGNQKNATFFFVNAAPQWQTFNGGNWNEVEKSVRNLAGARNLDLEVYTGTHGLMTLPHATSGKQTPLYLYSDGGHQGIPAPRMYWKVVYNRKTKAGIALVGLNNPYNKTITDDVLCTDICNQVKFAMSWNRTNIELGYGYCCDVNELRRKVKSIPNIAVTSVLL